MFEVPRLDEIGDRDGSFVLCREVFMELFKVGHTQLQRLQRRKADPNKCNSLKKKASGRNSFTQTVWDDLKAVLETEPRETSHYAMTSSDNPRRYYYCGGMCLFRFWIKYLQLYGTDEDQLFVAQAEETGFYPTYHRDQRYKKNKPVYSASDPQQLPTVSYRSTSGFWTEFDIKFEARKCDICETCFRLRCSMDRRENSQEEKETATKALFDHQKYAQLAIWVRSEWKRAVATNIFQKEHLQIYFAANPRCLYMELGQAFYNRILGVSVFIVVVSSLQNHTYVYMFNEQTAKKGWDEVISIMKMHFNKYLSSELVELDIHSDGCAGQSWNNQLDLFCHEIVDPDLGMFTKS